MYCYKCFWQRNFNRIETNESLLPCRVMGLKLELITLLEKFGLGTFSFRLFFGTILIIFYRLEFQGCQLRNETKYQSSIILDNPDVSSPRSKI